MDVLNKLMVDIFCPDITPWINNSVEQSESTEVSENCQPHHRCYSKLYS